MRFEWNLKPGQTLHNTKASERKLELYAPKSEWGEILRRVNIRQTVNEAIERERAHKKGLKEGSQAMTALWYDSVENISKRKKEAMVRKLRNMDDYDGDGTDDGANKRTINDELDELLKQTINVRERREMAEVMKQRAIRENYPNINLSKALVFTEVMKERDKQIEHQELQREIDKKQEKIFGDQIIKQDEAFKAEAMQKQLKSRKKAIDLVNFQKKQIEEKAKKWAAEEERIDTKEYEDRISDNLALEKVKQEDKVMRKMKALEQLHKHRADVLVKHIKNVKESEEMVTVGHLFKSITEKRDCGIRAQKKRTMLDKMAKNLYRHVQYMEKVKPKYWDQDDLIKNYAAEKEAERQTIQEERDQTRRNRQKDVNEHLKMCIAKREERTKLENEMVEYRLLCRFKQDDVRLHLDEKHEGNRKKMALNYQTKLIEQAERDREKRKKEDEYQRTDHASQISIKTQDDNYFRYAEEVLEEARKKGRNTYIIEKEIMNYKKRNMLPRSCKPTCEDYKEEQIVRRAPPMECLPLI